MGEGVAHRLARAPLPTITTTTGRALPLLAGLAIVVALGWWLSARRRIPARLGLVASFDRDVTVAGWALGFSFDLTLGGRAEAAPP